MYQEVSICLASRNKSTKLSLTGKKSASCYSLKAPLRGIRLHRPWVSLKHWPVAGLFMKAGLTHSQRHMRLDAKTRSCEHIKHHWTGHFKRVNFTDVNYISIFLHRVIMVQGQPQSSLSLSMTPNKTYNNTVLLKSPGNKTHSGYKKKRKREKLRPHRKLAFTCIYVHMFTEFILEMSTLSDLFFGKLAISLQSLTWIRCWKLLLTPTLPLWTNTLWLSSFFLFCHKGSQE